MLAGRALAGLGRELCTRRWRGRTIHNKTTGSYVTEIALQCYRSYRRSDLCLLCSLGDLLFRAFEAGQILNDRTNVFLATPQSPPNAMPRNAVGAAAFTFWPEAIFVTKDLGTIRLIGIIFTPVSPGLMLACGVSGMV
jgi:hypothetical protein